MIDVALSVLALVAGGLTLELYAAATTVPLRHQDEHSLHLGIQPRTHAEDCPGVKSS